MKVSRIPLVTTLLMALILLAPLVAIAGDKLELAKDLIAAADSGAIASVKRLLGQGADVNGTDILQRRALPLAAAKGHVEIVKLLLEKGADIEATDQDCLTPLMNACERGRLEVAQLHLDKGADVNAQTKSGSTALRKAINEEYLEVVTLLLDRGADVKNKLNDGTFILQSAAMTGNVDIVKAILDKGADINARDDKGSSALTWAAFNDRSEAVQLLKSRGAQSDISVAAITGDKEEVKRFLDAGADVNATDGLEWTPLMYAAKKVQAAVVKLLLERGADPAKRVKGRTAYDLGLNQVLTILEEKKTGVRQNYDAQRTLVSASGVGKIDVVKHLLAKGVDVNEGLPDGESPGLTPLMAACAEGHIAVAKLLLDNGAAVDQRDDRGDTALIHAAVSGATLGLKFLLANGVDVDQRGAGDVTALMRASSRGEMESVIILLANGADVNAVSEHGYTALNFARIALVRDLLKAHGAK